LDFLANYVGYVQFPFSYSGLQEKKKNKEQISTLKKDKKDIHLSEFLFELIEPPLEKDVSIVLDKLHKLDCISINKDTNIGTITIIGRGCATFQQEPALSRTLLASYNYKCKNSICDFLSFLEFSEGKMSKLFIQPEKMFKNKNEKEIKKTLTNFEKVLKYFANPYGDILSVINILREYKENKYGIYDQHTNKLLKNKLSNEEFNEWIDEHYLSKNNIKLILLDSKQQYQKRFKKFIDGELQNNPTQKQSKLLLRKNEEIVISEVEDENIFNSICDGMLMNICKKNMINGSSKFETCYPSVSVKENLSNNFSKTYGIEPNTFVGYSNEKFKYIIPIEISKIFTNINFSMVSIIPDYYIEKLNANTHINDIYSKNKQELINTCNNKIIKEVSQTTKQITKSKKSINTEKPKEKIKSIKKETKSTKKKTKSTKKKAKSIKKETKSTKKEAKSTKKKTKK